MHIKFRQELFIGLLILLVTVCVVLIKVYDYSSKVLGDSVDIYAYILSCELTVISIPKERTTGNFSNPIQVTIRDGDDLSLIATLSGTTNSLGRVTFDLCAAGYKLGIGNYAFDIKGTSHLTRRIFRTDGLNHRYYTLNASSPQDRLIPGEVGNVDNEEINSLDLGKLLTYLNGRNSVSGSGYIRKFDFNNDKKVNQTDIAILIKYLYQTGEVTRDPNGPIAAGSRASFEFLPDTTRFSQCTQVVDIIIDPKGIPVNAADIKVTFDPSIVYIDDADLSIPGTQLFTGDAFTSYFGEVVDNQTGEILLTAGNTPGEPLTTTLRSLFASLRFVYFGYGQEWVEFKIEFTKVGNTIDSNISAADTSHDILNQVVNGRYYFTADCEDETPTIPTSPDYTDVPVGDVTDPISSISGGICAGFADNIAAFNTCESLIRVVPIVCGVNFLLLLLVIIVLRRPERYFTFVDSDPMSNFIYETRPRALRHAQHNYSEFQNVELIHYNQPGNSN